MKYISTNSSMDADEMAWHPPIWSDKYESYGVKKNISKLMLWPFCITIKIELAFKSEVSRRKSNMKI